MPHGKTPKPAKVYQTSRKEVAKTVIIAVLVTAIVAFIGGMKVANNNHAQMDKAVKSAQIQVKK